MHIVGSVPFTVFEKSKKSKSSIFRAKLSSFLNYRICKLWYSTLPNMGMNRNKLITVTPEELTLGYGIGFLNFRVRYILVNFIASRI